MPSCVQLTRIGVARVEKRQGGQDGASLYMVHDFYALDGLELPRHYGAEASSSSSARHDVGTLRGVGSELLRCVVMAVWSWQRFRASLTARLYTCSQQFDRCVSAVQCYWSFRSTSSTAKSPKMQRADSRNDFAVLPGSPPI